jgi:hypothetical protein
MQNVNEKQTFGSWVSPGVAYLIRSSSTLEEFAPALTLVNTVVWLGDTTLNRIWLKASRKERSANDLSDRLIMTR